MFQTLHPFTQSVFAFPRPDGQPALEDDGSAVKLGRDEMDAAAVPVLTGGQYPGVGMQAAIGGQQRRVHIKHSTLEVGYEIGREDPHEASQRNEVGGEPDDLGFERGLECRAVGVAGVIDDA